jgi:hypothetical protein
MGRPKSTIERVCCVEGCGKPLAARGYCKQCYYQSDAWKLANKLGWQRKLKVLVNKLGYSDTAKCKLLGETL